MKKEERKPKYGIGDKVKVVNYGSKMWWNKAQYPEMMRHMKKDTLDFNNFVMWGKKTDSKLPDIDFNDKPDNIIGETEDVWVTDSNPKWVGQEGLICTVSMTQGTPSYAIDGIKGKHAWYDEGQLELVSKNPNNE